MSFVPKSISVNLKVACATATVATAWAGTASAATQWNLDVQTTKALSNVRLIYNVGGSGGFSDVIDLPDISSTPGGGSVTHQISLDINTDLLDWTLAGLYEPAIGEVGIMAGFYDPEGQLVGDPWQADAPFDERVFRVTDPSEVTVIGWLEAPPGTTDGFLQNWLIFDWPFILATDDSGLFSSRAKIDKENTLYSFTNATLSGSANLTLIPEPSMAGLLGCGFALSLMRRRGSIRGDVSAPIE